MHYKTRRPIDKKSKKKKRGREREMERVSKLFVASLIALLLVGNEMRVAGVLECCDRCVESFGGLYTCADFSIESEKPCHEGCHRCVCTISVPSGCICLDRFDVCPAPCSDNELALGKRP